MNILTEMSREDRQRSYDETYVSVTINNTPTVVLISSFDDNNVYGYDVKTRKSIVFSVLDIDTEVPDLGMCWHNNTLYYVCRQPERQWRRGVRVRGLKAYILGSDGSSTKQNPTTNLVESILVKYIEDKGEQNDNVITRDFGRKGNMLFFRSLPVGMFKGKSLMMYYNIPLNNIPYFEEYKICQDH